MNTGTHAGATPLLIACQNGRAGVAQLLLGRADVDVNRATTCRKANANHGVTPLFLAAANGHIRVVQMLLRRGDVQVS